MSRLYFLIIAILLMSCSKREKELIYEDAKSWEKLVDSVFVKHRYNASNGLELPYRLFEPNSITNKIPLVVFLHGRGDRGTENGARIYNEAGMFMNVNSLLTTSSQKSYPCYVLVPQCSNKTENEEWAKWEGNTPETPFNGLGKDGSYKMNLEPSDSGKAALELIDAIVKDYKIDASRVYIVGLSMGGFGVWEFTARRPDLFAAAVPMAGYSDPNQIDKIRHIPYWIFHGDTDKWNPVQGSRHMFSILQNNRADVIYTEYKNTGHIDAFKKAFKEPELIKWIFSKTKTNND